jgi:hypothetical protein
MNLAGIVFQKRKKQKNADRRASKTLGHYYCSDNLSLAYIRIPKCACTTIEKWMASQHPRYLSRPDYPAHSREAKENYFDKVVKNVKSDEGYLRFTFVRHPEDRFISFFNDKLAGTKKEPALLEKLKEFGLYHGMSRLDCLEAIADQPETFDFNPHFAPQHHFLLRGEEIKADFIGRLERFSMDSIILQRAGNVEKEFPATNKARRNNIDLTTRERNILQHIYKEDFILLGYPFR